jgi:hypothetical protein
VGTAVFVAVGDGVSVRVGVSVGGGGVEVAVGGRGVEVAVGGGDVGVGLGGRGVGVAVGWVESTIKVTASNQTLSFP